MKQTLPKLILSFTILTLLTSNVSAQEKQGHDQCRKDIAALIKRLKKVEQELERVKLSIKLKAIPKAEGSPWILRKKAVVKKVNRVGKAVPKNKAVVKKPDAAIDSSLRWLKKNQQSDGSWKGNKPSQSLTVTSKAMVVFINNGHTHRFGDYKRVVAKALKYLRSHQYENGWFQSNSKDGSLDLPSHCEATTALANLFAVSVDFKLKKPLENARDAILRAELTDGGWSSSGSGRADAFLSSQVLITFKALGYGGVKAPVQSISKTLKILSSYTNLTSGQVGQFSAKDNGAVAPKGSEKYAAHPITTAIATVSQVSYVSYVLSKPTIENLKFLFSQTPHFAKDSKHSVDILHWYFTTMALSHSKTYKTYGKAWHKKIHSALIPTQNKDGSWPMVGPWSRHYGQVWATAMSAYTLQFVR